MLLCLKVRCEEAPCFTADVDVNELEALHDHYLIGGKGACKDSLPPAFCGHKSGVIKLYFANPLCSGGMMPTPAIINLQLMSHQLFQVVFKPLTICPDFDKLILRGDIFHQLSL